MLLPPCHSLYVRVYGDAETKAHESDMPRDRALWLCNHRTRIDWMLLWSVAWRTQTLHQLRIVLKAPLRKIPIFGWAMQHFLFIFLKRRWVDDQVKLRKFLPFLKSVEPEASYLLFPEGTDLSKNNLEKSAVFAKSNGLMLRQYTLYPRTNGWTFMFPLLSSQLSAVYDVTMFYVDYASNERPSEASLLNGRLPRMIVFYIERVKISSLRGKSESELATWLERRFERKESFLRTFYEENGKLPDDAQLLFQQSQRSATAVVVAFWLVLICATSIFISTFVSIVVSAVVATGYAMSIAYGPGIDGYLLEIFK
ncbi:hypothetical protein CCR75_000993 [Bremia lactucae]|uniref:Phospholipid/glycerol acyltransferase domain-containing protein n=1 Tax=Bremia lactucae TaxID=4779 RepID=A0A976II07_BRELC|nr:hypothetical protein CCR75_000993 [Bremia lactucae]